MNVHASRVVLWKELLDVVRDRKAVGLMLATAILSPLIYVAIQMIGAIRQRNTSALVLPVAGVEHAPELVDWLRQQTEVDVVSAPADPAAAVRNRTADVILVVEPDFGDRMSRGVTAKVRLFADTSRTASAAKLARTRALIDGYGLQLASLRLTARGIAPEVAAPVRTEDVDVSSLDQRLVSALLALPIFFAAAALMCSMPVAVDATAGERERGSLEPLLLNPLTSGAIVGGKWLAASVVSGSMALCCVVFSIGAFQLVPWHEFGMRTPPVLNARTVWHMLALYVPLSLFMSALTICLATFSRSFKEAQSLGAVLMPVPLLPFVVSFFLPLMNRPWLAPVPVVGQFALAADVLGGGSPAPLWYVLAATSDLAMALVFVGLAARLFRRESIVFGR